MKNCPNKTDQSKVKDYQEEKVKNICLRISYSLSLAKFKGNDVSVKERDAICLFA